jgi:arsenate reductase (thioredoxin)
VGDFPYAGQHPGRRRGLGGVRQRWVGRACRKFRRTMLRSRTEGLAGGSLLRKMTANETYNVLFLCTGNSARSILAESLLNQWGQGKFHGFSAGSFPKGQVHPLAIELLQRMNLPVEGFRSKSWDEFAAAGAPPIDFIFTVCDNAAGEVCPVWPGKPMTAHWGIADPAAVEGTEADKAFAFRKALKELETRIKLFTNLPIDSLDRMTLQSRLREIGKSSTGAESG